MKKIPSLFKRNYEGDHLVRDEVVPGCEWVLNGEGIATRKWDGTAVMFRDGELYKRYDVKGRRTPPEGWIFCETVPDPVSGHWPGWVPVSAENKQDKWFVAAWTRFILGHKEEGKTIEDSTYELCGPHFQGNPEGLTVDGFIRHGASDLVNPMEICPRDFEGIKAWLVDKDIEGVVWHHPDGRMAKIKKRDFGLPRT